MTRAIRNKCSAAVVAALVLVEVGALQLSSMGRELQFENSMWGGGELEQLSLMRLHVQRTRDHDVKYTGPAESNVQVLGLQNTGTNLLFSMLWTNYASRLKFYDLSGNYEHKGIWKHANPKDVFEHNKSRLAQIVANNVTALIMVRDPMSWLQSMKKAPYELENCVSGSDWLNRSCLHELPDGYPVERAHPRTLASLEAVWNVWMYAYEHLTYHGFEHGLIIRYEDLVEYPRRTMDAIGSYLGMRKPFGGWDIMEDSAKDHGDSHGRSVAIERITTKSFMQEFTGTEVASACARLDKELLDRHGYDSCQAHAVANPRARRQTDAQALKAAVGPVLGALDTPVAALLLTQAETASAKANQPSLEEGMFSTKA